MIPMLPIMIVIILTQARIIIIAGKIISALLLQKIFLFKVLS